MEWSVAMFVPPTYPAHVLNFTDAQLDAMQKCLCGKDVKLRDAVVCWTHPLNNNENYGWFTACDTNCITAKVTEGAA